MADRDAATARFLASVLVAHADRLDDAKTLEADRRRLRGNVRRMIRAFTDLETTKAGRMHLLAVLDRRAPAYAKPPARATSAADRTTWKRGIAKLAQEELSDVGPFAPLSLVEDALATWPEKTRGRSSRRWPNVMKLAIALGLASEAITLKTFREEMNDLAE